MNDGGPAYPESADAALALCERWDMAWERVYDEDAEHGFATIMVYPENDRFDCDESDTCKFPRALLNAACAARHAKEMADASN